MKAALIVVLMACIGCQKPYNKSNNSYYSSVPELWQVKISKIIIDKNTYKRTKEYNKWVEKQRELDTSEKKTINGS